MNEITAIAQNKLRDLEREDNRDAELLLVIIERMENRLQRMRRIAMELIELQEKAKDCEPV